MATAIPSSPRSTLITCSTSGCRQLTLSRTDLRIAQKWNGDRWPVDEPIRALFTTTLTVKSLRRSGLFTRRAMSGQGVVLMVRSQIRKDPVLPQSCCASSPNIAGRDRKHGKGQLGHIPGFLLCSSLYLMQRDDVPGSERSKSLCQTRLVSLALVLWESLWPTTYSKQVFLLLFTI